MLLSLECFVTYDVGRYGKVHLRNNHAYTINGIGIAHLALDNGQ